MIDPNQNRYLSEDYMFCQWARNIGLKVWMCPWMNMVHVGTFNFAGNMQAISQVPNASHGGMIDQAAVQSAGQQPWNPGIPKPGGPAMTPPPLGNLVPPTPDGEHKDRAERRREEMKKRREAKKIRKEGGRQKVKYNEKQILKEVEDYIESTYGEHYVGKNEFQIQDLLNSIDISVPFCQANAIKYLARWGKKKVEIDLTY